MRLNLVAFAACLLGATMIATAGGASSLPVIDAVIYTRDGEVPLMLEVAATPEARMTGLMDRDTIGPRDGMLFLFPVEHAYGFWMKNTNIPLDILFIDAKRRIVHIEAEATPHSLTERKPPVPVLSAIELDGGRASRDGIAVGDHLRYELPPMLEIR